MSGWPTTLFNWLGFGQYSATPPTLSNGQTTALQVDANGNLLVNMGGLGIPTWFVELSGLTYQGVLKGAPGRLWRIIANNEGATRRFLQVFDRTSVPANGTAPLFSIPFAAGDVEHLDLARGRAFANGIVYAVSTTAATLTLDTAATFYISAEVS